MPWFLSTARSRENQRPRQYAFGPFEEPVEVQLRLDTPIGAVTSDKKNATEDGQILDFTFANMVEISDYHDEATIYLNGESTGAKERLYPSGVCSALSNRKIRCRWKWRSTVN